MATAEHEKRINPRVEEVSDWVYSYKGLIVVVDNGKILQINPEKKQYIEVNKKDLMQLGYLDLLERKKDIFKYII